MCVAWVYVRGSLLCLDFFIYKVYARITLHVFLHFLSMPIDVSSIEVLLHEESTRTHCHTRALALTHTRRRCDGGKSLTDCFLPCPHRSLAFRRECVCLDFFSYKAYTRIASHACSCIFLSMPIDLSSIDVLLHGGKHPHTLSRAHTCSDAHKKALRWFQECA